MGERPRTVLDFWMRKKLKRRESSSNFLHHPTSFSDPSSTSERFKIIEEGDQVSLPTEADCAS